ncbi:MAG: response regulator [Pseudomonadota bacterium]
MTAPARSPAPDAGAAPIPHLMLIDDERLDRMLYGRVIERSGLVGETHSFALAEDALDFLRRPDRPQIDAILLDINMPRMTGFDFLDTAVAEFGSSFARVVVVMLTTSMAPQDRERAGRYQAVKDFLNKPLTIEQLRHISGLLES